MVDRVLSEGSAEWMVGGRTLTLKRAFVEDVRAAALHEKIRGLRIAAADPALADRQHRRHRERE